MEIEYTDFGLDSDIFKLNMINGIISLGDNYVYKNIYNTKKPVFYDKIPIFIQLYFGKFNENLEFTKKLIDDFDLKKDTLKRNINEISDEEKIKVYLVELLSSKSKVIILKYIDSYLNSRDLQSIFNKLSSYLEKYDKTVIFETSNPDNVVKVAKYIIVTKDNKVIYKGRDFSKMPVKTSLMEFTDLANKKGAKLDNYKDINDLLKAVYRSVEEK